MFADTDAIRAFGAANTAQAADLAAVAAALSSMPDTAASSMLGPVGARFVEALADAATDASRAVAALGDSLSTASTTAHASASGYDAADRRAGAAVFGV
jgi:hypothetical protein